MFLAKDKNPYPLTCILSLDSIAYNEIYIMESHLVDILLNH